LTRLIKDPELTARLGRQGRKWVIENRTWKRAGKLVVGVYDWVIDAAKKRTEATGDGFMPLAGEASSPTDPTHQ
jgi:hypothetical protein